MMTPETEQTPNVFVSIASPTSDEQKRFKLGLLNCLRSQGLSPRTVGDGPEDSDHTHERPLDRSVAILKECRGAVIIAYEKDLATDLVRRRIDGPSQHTENARLTSAWNYAEAAVAYSLCLPLLILCERGVKKEGMIEPGVLGYVADIDLGQDALGSSVFQGRLQGWVGAVRKQSSAPSNTVESQFAAVSLGDLISLAERAKITTIAAVIGILLTVLSATFWLGVRLTPLFK